MSDESHFRTATHGPSESNPRRGEALDIAAVVPTHDTRELTLRCVSSLLAAGFDPARIWVVDDASQDETLRALERATPGVEILMNSEQLGFTESSNRGLDAAVNLSDPPALLALVNSDAFVPSDLLVYVKSAFERPEVGLWAPQLIYPDGREQWSGGHSLPGLLWLAVNASGLLHRQPPELRDQTSPAGARARAIGTARDLRRVAWLPATCLVLRTELWREIGPLCPDFRLYAQDLDLCSRARQAGWLALLDQRVRVVHEHGATVRQSSASSRDLQRLLLDLHLWSRRHRGPRWAAAAKVALLAGGCAGFLVDTVRALTRPASSENSGNSGSAESRALRQTATRVRYHERWRALRALLAH